MKDDIDINRQCKVAYARGNSVLRKFGMCCFFQHIIDYKSDMAEIYKMY